ncbi:hypothetical protein LTR78_000598 [Recurvomyces mirabilis]|uniref:Major facilitator superfamily (MFS) profile domain-containing protein n=1 Tax=Recurvomyces mirabilis TaxID=574656 RepID=A0AAE0WXK3_9PEZI|nr:hypothetical protein LTR78_000598 [Recurvomyces mirabilis]KAK5162252.1 hypothetical protein LTS14_000599 [Recurvomyces mirabilis]
MSSPYSRQTPHFAPPDTHYGPMYERSTNLFEAAMYARAYQESINPEPAELDGTDPQQPILPNDYVKPESQTEEPRRKVLKLSALHEALFLGVVLAAQFMAMAGLGQATAPAGVMAKSLNAVLPAQRMWFTAAYAMTTGIFILIASRIGDVLGHKRIFIFGYLWLGVWSGFAGCTAYIGQQAPFDFCRGMQGIGSAMLIAGAFSLLDRAHHPGMKKKMILTVFGAMAPCGLVFGAVFASIFAQCAWWPWAFWSFAIASWTLSTLALLVIPESLVHNAQFFDMEDRPSMDWTGSLLGVVGLMLVAIGLNNAPVFGWQKPHVVFLLVVGLISFTVFFWIESRDLYPLIPVKSLNLTVLWIVVMLALGWTSFGIWLVYSCRYLVELRGQTAIAVAAGLIPLLLVGSIAAAVVVYMVQHQHLSFALLMALLSFFVSEIIAAAQPMRQSYWAQTFISTLIMPFGMVLIYPTSIILLSDSLPPEHHNLAPALVNTVVFYSISLALGIAGSVEVQVNLNKTDTVDMKYGMLCAKYTGVALAGFGLILGALFFGKRVIRDGWLANR